MIYPDPLEKSLSNPSSILISKLNKKNLMNMIFEHSLCPTKCHFLKEMDLLFTRHFLIQGYVLEPALMVVPYLCWKWISYCGKEVVDSVPHGIVFGHYG